MHTPPRAPAAVFQWVTYIMWHIASSRPGRQSHTLSPSVWLWKRAQPSLPWCRGVRFETLFLLDLTGSLAQFHSATWLLRELNPSFFFFCSIPLHFLQSIPKSSNFYCAVDLESHHVPPCQYSDICSGFYSIWRNYMVEKSSCPPLTFLHLMVHSQLHQSILFGTEAVW